MVTEWPRRLCPLRRGRGAGGGNCAPAQLGAPRFSPASPPPPASTTHLPGRAGGLQPAGAPWTHLLMHKHSLSLWLWKPTRASVFPSELFGGHGARIWRRKRKSRQRPPRHGRCAANRGRARSGLCAAESEDAGCWQNLCSRGFRRGQSSCRGSGRTALLAACVPPRAHGAPPSRFHHRGYEHSRGGRMWS